MNPEIRAARLNRRGDAPDTKTCVKCGALFGRVLNGSKRWMERKYCSIQCYGRVRDMSLPETIICDVCGVEFGRPPKLSASAWRTRLSCSPKCAVEKKKTHSASETREYRIWTNMKNRCLNPRSQDYALYGGRGIAICPQWTTDFSSFLRDMGTAPIGMSLDRENNELGYGPDNCKWATPTQQSRNRRSNVVLSLNGRRMTMAEWAIEINVSPETIRRRMRNGLSVGEVLKARPR